MRKERAASSTWGKYEYVCATAWFYSGSLCEKWAPSQGPTPGIAGLQSTNSRDRPPGKSFKLRIEIRIDEAFDRGLRISRISTKPEPVDFPQTAASQVEGISSLGS